MEGVLLEDFNDYNIVGYDKSSYIYYSYLSEGNKQDSTGTHYRMINL